MIHKTIQSLLLTLALSALSATAASAEIYVALPEAYSPANPAIGDTDCWLGLLGSASC